VITVTPDLRSAGSGSQLADRTFDGRQLTEEALNLLDVSAERAVEIRTPTGDPAEVLVETAREIGADLLVVGRQDGDFVARTLLGSVAQRVVQHAPCDVLVVA
jgi:nucleotide-binding universal stress UspA family protein